MTADELAAQGFEFRFDLAGRAAVRVAGGPVAPRHVEPVPPPAPWVASARCGDAAGWLLANEAPADPGQATARLERLVDRTAALALQERARLGAPMAAELLERLTHRLRTDVTTLQAVAEGALAGLFEPEDLAVLPAELERTGREAQRRLSGVREVMTVLEPVTAPVPEAIVETLRAELESAGREASVSGPTGEVPFAIVPGAGWSACARMLADDTRLTTFAVEPDPAGWRVRGGGAGEPVEWTERSVGALVHAGHLALAAGGTAAATTDPFGITLVLPAAPPSS